ncbi:MAG: hypothetical protein ACLFTB_05315 [Desulfovibrionales bacterium]
MAMPCSVISCTGCNFKEINYQNSIELEYRLDNGEIVQLERRGGWCRECRTVRDIEPDFDVESLRERISSEQRKVNLPSHPLSLFIRRVFGCPKKERRYLRHLKGQLRIAEQRASGPRCLLCGSQRTQPLTFDDQGRSENFLHDCGGYLQLKSTDFYASCFNFSPQTIFLDKEGSRRGVKEDSTPIQSRN